MTHGKPQTEPDPRFARQLILPGWRSTTQNRLANCRVVLPAALESCAIYLAAAGITKFYLAGDNSGIAQTLLQFQPESQFLAEPIGDWSISTSTYPLPSGTSCPASIALAANERSESERRATVIRPNSSPQQFTSPPVGEFVEGVWLASLLIQHVLHA